MDRPRPRSILTRATASALACLLCLASSGRAGAAKGELKKSDAQKLIAALSLLELSKGAVTVKEITSDASSATVNAAVKMGFRYERDAKGVWHVAEVRVGERQWEEFDLLARAAGADAVARARAALDSVAAELVELSLAKKKRDDEEKKKKEASREDAAAAEKGGKGKKKSGAADKKAEGAADKNGSNDDALVRGALRVKSPETALSGMGKSAVVEAEVEGVFEFVRDGGSWRVAAARLGGERLADFDATVRKLDSEKAARARADLESLAAALEAFRRERGFYVVADSGVVLVDHLNPRYTDRFIRLDPWHRQYEYEGTPERFTLRSLGADGKPHTVDDIERRGGR
ncbi:MAG: type II secretion system protein GspG [Acidobacteria bacterium]|nr:type II secretion system protein GspG [Acidobacteriota bacterium]MCA1640650.1 type II secretion system protein GspG [Acidobacteriota bacterium]